MTDENNATAANIVTAIDEDAEIKARLEEIQTEIKRGIKFVTKMKVNVKNWNKGLLLHYYRRIAEVEDDIQMERNSAEGNKILLRHYYRRIAEIEDDIQYCAAEVLYAKNKLEELIVAAVKLQVDAAKKAAALKAEVDNAAK